MRVNAKPPPGYRPTPFVFRLILTGLLLGMLAALPGCAVVHHYDSITGKVVDLDTGEPLEGAAVHASYYTTFYNMIDPTSWYLNSQETLTDAKGEFIIPAQFSFAFRPMNLFDDMVLFRIFKPGHECFPGKNTRPSLIYLKEKDRNIILLPKTVTREQHLQSLSCHPWSSDITVDEYPILFDLLNKESINLGLGPLQPVQ